MIVHLIAGARPNFMKIAPLYRALLHSGWCTPKVVHTGQHFDEHMCSDILNDLRLPLAHQLNVRGSTHAEQIGWTAIAYESLLRAEKPAAVVVPGDVNGSVGAALAASRAGVPLVHLEAGLRSFDHTMPEEINRKLIDSMAQLHWAPSSDAMYNLRDEGIRTGDWVGNIMIDSLLALWPRIHRIPVPSYQYVLATFHRPSNVDSPERLRDIVLALNALKRGPRVIWPMHPRTKANIGKFGITVPPDIKVCEPMSYIEFMALAGAATMVITDSGGVQEETTYMRVPCATVRDNTERPATLTMNGGTNRLIAPGMIPAAVKMAVEGKWPTSVGAPLLWDGDTAHRCAQSLAKFLGVA